MDGIFNYFEVMDRILATKSPSVSVIIPFKKATPYLYDCVRSLLDQTVSNFELICIPDSQEGLDLADERILIVPKEGTPSAKRNYGVSTSHSENIAFIDDDAVPPRNWLETGLFDLEKEKVIGGPNVAPKGEGVKRIASDLFFTSVFGSFREVYRYRPFANKRYMDNVPTVNMFIKRDLYNKLGGFNLSFWPGEDTHLSEELKKNGYRIYYDPALIVYHHRREVFKGHLKQMWRYSKYRGAALKIGEFKPFYLIPSVFVVLVLILIFLSVDWSVTIGYISIVAVLLISMVILVDFYLKCGSLLASALGVLTVWSSHITYGIGVLYGMLFTNLHTTAQIQKSSPKK